MSSASHLDCQTLAVRLGIFQREPEITCLTSTLHFSSLLLYSSPVFPSSHSIFLFSSSSYHLRLSPSFTLPPSLSSRPRVSACHIRGGRCACLCVSVCDRQGVDQSARKETEQRKGNKSADSKKKKQAASDSMGG